MEEAGEIRRKERLGYIILQYLHTFSAEPSPVLFPDVIAAALAVTPEETREILIMLVEQGYVSWTEPAGAASLTSEGEDYLLRRAARRRSVRFRWIRKSGPMDTAEFRRPDPEARADPGVPNHPPEGQPVDPGNEAQNKRR